jgi:hypothetical protein
VNPCTKEIYPVKDKALVIYPAKGRVLGIANPPVKSSRTAPLIDFAEIKRLKNEKEAIQRNIREREEDIEAEAFIKENEFPRMTIKHKYSKNDDMEDLNMD